MWFIVDYITDRILYTQHDKPSAEDLKKVARDLSANGSRGGVYVIEGEHHREMNTDHKDDEKKVGIRSKATTERFVKQEAVAHATFAAIEARLRAEGFVVIDGCVMCETVEDANRVLMVWREEFAKVEG